MFGVGLWVDGSRGCAVSEHFVILRAKRMVIRAKVLGENILKDNLLSLSLPCQNGVNLSEEFIVSFLSF